MHEWRNLVYAPDLGSDAEMHVGSSPTSCTVQGIKKEGNESMDKLEIKGKVNIYG